MEPLVKERNRRVHYKNSEAHSFWIRAEIPDHQGDETDSHTKMIPPFVLIGEVT